MSKKFYETPQCEAFEMVLQNVVLQGSNFGDPGQPGSDLDLLDELVF